MVHGFRKVALQQLAGLCSAAAVMALAGLCSAAAVMALAGLCSAAAVMALAATRHPVGVGNTGSWLGW
jgi:hypothetical protein